MRKHAFISTPHIAPGLNTRVPPCFECGEPEDHRNHRRVVITKFVRPDVQAVAPDAKENR